MELYRRIGREDTKLIEPTRNHRYFIMEKERKDLRLEQDNLCCLCSYHHKEVHREYEKGNVSKIEMQNKLCGLVRKSKRELNGE